MPVAIPGVGRYSITNCQIYELKVKKTETIITIGLLFNSSCLNNVSSTIVSGALTHYCTTDVVQAGTVENETN